MMFLLLKSNDVRDSLVKRPRYLPNLFVQVSVQLNPLSWKEPHLLKMNLLLTCIFHVWISFISTKKTNASSLTSATKTTFIVSSSDMFWTPLLIVFASCTNANTPQPSPTRSGSASRTGYSPLTMGAGTFSFWCILDRF